MANHTVLEPDLRMVTLRLPVVQWFWTFFFWEIIIIARTALKCYCVFCFCQTFCKALILLRNKDLIAPTGLLELFFELLRCHDKLLRKVRGLRSCTASVELVFSLLFKITATRFISGNSVRLFVLFLRCEPIVNCCRPSLAQLL